MKLIHISDIHINPEPVCGLDPVENFRRCLAHVEVNHADADRVVITGDLTHHGREESYRLLAAMLDELQPAHIDSSAAVSVPAAARLIDARCILHSA